MFSEFSSPGWFFLLFIPILLKSLPKMRRRAHEEDRVRQYADLHLLPYLLLSGTTAKKKKHKKVYWGFLWSLGTLAMAGPHWGYTDLEIRQPGSDLVILLDLSRSMEVKDVKPSRIVRARQEIDDLLRLKSGLRVGLIGYASVAHVLAPITEDAETLRNLLPSLSPELVRLPGSRLSSALDRARRLFSSQLPGATRHLLLISDGDFDEPDLETMVSKLHQDGIRLHVLGIGTEQGGQVPLKDEVLRDPKTGNEVISKMDELLLRGLASAGGGEYQHASFQEEDTRALLQAIFGDAGTTQNHHYRVWHEWYYLLVILMLMLILPWFRRNVAIFT